MAKGKTAANHDILEYALTHLEREREVIQNKINHIRQQLGKRINSLGAAVAGEAAQAAPAKGKRVLSAAARQRIAAAQKKRWAAHRKAKSTAKKSA